VIHFLIYPDVLILHGTQPLLRVFAANPTRRLPARISRVLRLHAAHRYFYSTVLGAAFVGVVTGNRIRFSIPV
jgi:hypothetical protein